MDLELNYQNVNRLTELTAMKILRDKLIRDDIGTDKFLIKRKGPFKTLKLPTQAIYGP